MSRIGKAPVAVPKDVQVRVSGRVLNVKGPKGDLSLDVPPPLSVECAEGKLVVAAGSGGGRGVKALHGTIRARIANMVAGVQTHYRKVLDIVGLGFKAETTSKELLTFSLGRSHTVPFPIPKGIDVAVDAKKIQLTLSGADKDLVGAVAASIRALRPPEPYKGTGIREQGEHILRKAGKTAAGAGAGAAAKK